MESESSSNSGADRFLDASDVFFNENLQRRRLASGKKHSFSVMDTDPSSSSTNLDSFGKWTAVEENYVANSGNNPIDQFPGKNDTFKELIDSCEDMHATDSGQNRVEPFHSESNITNGEKSENFRATTSNDEDYSRPEPTSTDWSLLGLVISSIEFQLSLIISFLGFPPWLINSCFTFVFDPYRRGKHYILSRALELCDLELTDHKPILEIMRRLASGLFWAVYVGIVLFALLVSALIISGFVITHLAHEPLVIKESLNFDYTKNSPEAYVPISPGLGFDSSCDETGKIRSLNVNPPNLRTEITVLMTLPESSYNRNLGMFQIRVDFFSKTGQILASSSRPCMIRFRSEPINLVQTLLKIVPLVTGYVSEIQTLNLKLNSFVEKDVVSCSCLKIVIEQRAEFRSGAGIPEIYDAFLLLESQVTFFRRIIWNWRRTLFVWISLSLFVMELLVFLVFFRHLIIPRTGQRTQQRERTSSINTNSNLQG